MILTATEIFELQKSGNLLEPYEKELLNPNSYDLTLGDNFLRLKNSSDPLDPTDKSTIEYDELIRVKGEPFLLLPGEFMLATTTETVKLPKNVAGIIKGKSSLGRLGLFIQNAGFADAGFEGQITLELFNGSNRAIDLSNVSRIGQILFIKTYGEVVRAYEGKYQGQLGVTGSRSYRDYRK